jgi:hypothetical protein
MCDPPFNPTPFPFVSKTNSINKTEISQLYLHLTIFGKFVQFLIYKSLFVILAFLNKALVLLKLERYMDARHSCDKVIEFNKKCVKALYRRGLVSNPIYLLISNLPDDVKI